MYTYICLVLTIPTFALLSSNIIIQSRPEPIPRQATEQTDDRPIFCAGGCQVALEPVSAVFQFHHQLPVRYTRRDCFSNLRARLGTHFGLFCRRYWVLNDFALICQLGIIQAWFLRIHDPHRFAYFTSKRSWPFHLTVSVAGPIFGLISDVPALRGSLSTGTQKVLLTNAGGEARENVRVSKRSWIVPHWSLIAVLLPSLDWILGDHRHSGSTRSSLCLMVSDHLVQVFHQVFVACILCTDLCCSLRPHNILLSLGASGC